MAIARGEGSAKYVELVRPTKEKKLYWILGKPEALLTHWSAEQGSTMPCLEGNCRYCQLQQSRRQRFYYAVQGRKFPHGSDKWYPVDQILELTERDHRTVGELFQIGKVVCVDRPKERGLLNVSLPALQAKSAPPPAFELLPVLARVWGVAMSRLVEDEPAIADEQPTADGGDEPPILEFRKQA